MELTFFGKTALFVTAAISAVMGLSYIETQVKLVTINYKNGEPVPIYYLLSTKNIGEKAKFTISSQASWLFVYREGQPSQRSVTILTGNSLNFVLEAHPEQVSDGSHETTITITAASPVDSAIFETKVVEVKLNKNVSLALVSPTPSLATGNQTPIPSITQPGNTPTNVSKTPVVTPQETLFRPPVVSPTQFPRTRMTALPVMKTPTPSTSVVVSSNSSPFPSPTLSSQPLNDDPDKTPIFKRFWRFFRGLFR